MQSTAGGLPLEEGPLQERRCSDNGRNRSETTKLFMALGLWTMALYTGMRSGELYAHEWSSVDFDKHGLYVHKNWTNRVGFGPTKGRYWRTVPLSEHLISFLKELKLQRGIEKSVLPRFKEWRNGEQAAILRHFCDGVGITSIKFHT